MTKKILQVLLALLGLLFAFRFFLPGLISGASFFAQGGPISPHLDSEVRFLSALAGGFAAFFFYLLKDVERKGTLILIIGGTAFMGGLGRLISILAVGQPGPDLLVATGMELLIPVVAILLQRRVAREAAN